MKKMIIALLIGSCLLLTACGNKGYSQEEVDKMIQEAVNNASAETETEAETVDEGSDTETNSNSTGNKIQDDTGSKETTEATEENASTEKIQMNLGDTISTDFVEMTLDEIITADEIYPENPDSVYRYLSDADDETYIYLKGTIKNTSGDSYEFADNMFSQITIDDKYNYAGTMKANEEGDLSYIYAYLKPLQSETYFLVFSVPDELIETYSTVDIQLGFNELFEDDYHGSVDNCDYSYSIIATK